MKLLSTIRPGTSTPAPTGRALHGGDLRLFFSTLNPADFQTTPPPIMWRPGGHGALDTYKLPSNDVIALNLNVVADLPGILYVFGAIQVTTSAGVTYGPPVGQAAGLYAPGKPVCAILKGRSLGQTNGVNFDVGFELVVPWDGASADCHGSWWAAWH